MMDTFIIFLLLFVSRCLADNCEHEKFPFKLTKCLKTNLKVRFYVFQLFMVLFVEGPLKRRSKTLYRFFLLTL